MSKESTHRPEELKDLGWSLEEVSRYSELWDYRQRWGAINLEREDRLFLRKAEAALPKITTAKPSTKKPIKEKNYYRWLLFYLETMDSSEKELELKEGERGLWPIILEEEIRALDYYEPVLGLPDTLKAKALDSFREELIQLGRSSFNNQINLFDFDFIGPLKALQATDQTNKWRTLRDPDNEPKENYPVLPAEAANSFRKEVRTQIIPLIVKTLPSLADTEMPQPPDYWSRN